MRPIDLIAKHCLNKRSGRSRTCDEGEGSEGSTMSFAGSKKEFDSEQIEPLTSSLFRDQLTLSPAFEGVCGGDGLGNCFRLTSTFRHRMFYQNIGGWPESKRVFLIHANWAFPHCKIHPLLMSGRIRNTSADQFFFDLCLPSTAKNDPGEPKLARAFFPNEDSAGVPLSR